MIASYFHRLTKGKVQCVLCPHCCVIAEGETGKCKVRANREGVLYAETYKKFSSMVMDPIEKKPLYHYFPGKQVLSIGSVGCNMKCHWCQNCEISQQGYQGDIPLTELTVDSIIEKASSKNDCIGVAYTYNEPLIQIETVLEISQAVKNAGLKNILVSNGYIMQEALLELLPSVDAFNIDLKAFNKLTYTGYTGAQMSKVMKTLEIIASSRKHLEITCLVVPGINDKPEEIEKMVEWIRSVLGEKVPLHLSRYFPRYKFTASATDESFMLKSYKIAREKLQFVYLGNMYGHDYSHTKCPNCGGEIIRRTAYFVEIVSDCENGLCNNCNAKIF